MTDVGWVSSEYLQSLVPGIAVHYFLTVSGHGLGCVTWSPLRTLLLGPEGLQASLAFMAAQNHEDGQSGSNLAILAVQSHKKGVFPFFWPVWRPSASILRPVMLYRYNGNIGTFIAFKIVVCQVAILSQ